MSPICHGPKHPKGSPRMSNMVQGEVQRVPKREEKSKSNDNEFPKVSYVMVAFIVGRAGPKFMYFGDTTHRFGATYVISGQLWNIEGRHGIIVTHLRSFLQYSD
jgi:hypothetical protein